MAGLADYCVPPFRRLAAGVQNFPGHRVVNFPERMLKIAFRRVLGMTGKTKRRINVWLAQKYHGPQVGTLGHGVRRVAGRARHSALVVQREYVRRDADRR
jgi:hypothetical protein